MIRSHFGLAANPFDPSVNELLPHQRAVFDVLTVHARQGGLCLLMGEPGTGKSVLKQALADHDPKRLITPVLNRTLHTYTGTLQILCEVFGAEAKARDTHREKALIEVAFKLNAEEKGVSPPDMMFFAFLTSKHLLQPAPQSSDLALLGPSESIDSP